MVLQGERKGSLYYLDASVIKNGDINTVKTDPVSLWHLRLGHPANGSILQLIKKGVISGIDDKSDQACDDCILAKQRNSHILEVNTLLRLLWIMHIVTYGGLPQ